MQREYKDVIFTNHALERLQLRRISQEQAVRTIQSPDEKEREEDGDTKFIKNFNGREVQIIGTYLRDERKWMVKSAWVRGEDDPQPLWQQLINWLVKVLQGMLKGDNKRR